MTRYEARLELNPNGATTADVDGGWWPRTLDPAAAFPELVPVLVPWVGAVIRIAYNLGFWKSAPRVQTVHGRAIRYEGFHSIDPHTVTAIGTNTRRVSLLVVPPHTPGGVARAVLRAAAGADSSATVRDILSSNGVLPQEVPGSPADRPRPESIPEQRWEADGGYIRTADRRAAASPSSVR